jgi:hypothetical protein
MKLIVFRLVSAGVAVLAATLIIAQVSAHHSFASEFDINQPFEVSGAVKELVWSNPHARLHIDVEEDGETVTYDFELVSPNSLMRQGWSRNDLKVGDRVTVSGHRARNRRTVGRATGIVRDNGEAVFGGAGSLGLEE